MSGTAGALKLETSITTVECACLPCILRGVHISEQIYINVHICRDLEDLASGGDWVIWFLEILHLGTFLHCIWLSSLISKKEWKYKKTDASSSEFFPCFWDSFKSYVALHVSAPWHLVEPPCPIHKYREVNYIQRSPGFTSQCHGML